MLDGSKTSHVESDDNKWSPSRILIFESSPVYLFYAFESCSTHFFKTENSICMYFFHCYILTLNELLFSNTSVFQAY